MPGKRYLFGWGTCNPSPAAFFDFFIYPSFPSPGMREKTRLRILAGLVVGTIVTILVSSRSAGQDPFQIAAIFLLAMGITIALFWGIDRYKLI